MQTMAEAYRRGAAATIARVTASPYDAIARLYDAWSRSVTEDVPFYVHEAAAAGGPVVELGVGTGRIAIPVARRGIRVVGVDASREMLAICRERANAQRVGELLDLRLGDLRSPPVGERVRLVTCPFRAYLHLRDEDDRRRALASAYQLLLPGGRFVFDVFAPDADDIDATDRRWLEREPGIFERADWDPGSRTFTLHVCGAGTQTQLELAWAPPEEWERLLRETGFEVVAHYGWFDGRPYAGGEDSIWVARRP